jgi:hypothetical protein
MTSFSRKTKTNGKPSALHSLMAIVTSHGKRAYRRRRSANCGTTPQCASTLRKLRGRHATDGVSWLRPVIALAAIFLGTSDAFSGAIHNRPGADRIGGPSLHVRPTTPEELALAAGAPPDVTEPWDDYTWRAPDGHLWHTISGYSWRRVEFGPLHTNQPLSVVVPYIDYARALNFAVDFHHVGNELQINAFRVLSPVQLLYYVFPDDHGKEYIQLVGHLPAGNYTIAAKFFDLKSRTKLSDFDFANFRANPLGFDLPLAESLQITAQRIAFQVVPEPSSALALCLGLVPLIQRRHARPDRMRPYRGPVAKE